MMTDRRTFLKHLGALALTFACNPLEAINKGQDKRPNKTRQLTILHTNDTHSCIEPEKDGGAGALNRALIIEAIRDSVGADNMLLLDCGDFSQGSLIASAQVTWK